MAILFINKGLYESRQPSEYLSGIYAIFFLCYSKWKFIFFFLAFMFCHQFTYCHLMVLVLHLMKSKLYSFRKKKRFHAKFSKIVLDFRQRVNSYYCFEFFFFCIFYLFIYFVFYKISNCMLKTKYKNIHLFWELLSMRLNSLFKIIYLFIFDLQLSYMIL